MSEAELSDSQSAREAVLQELARRFPAFMAEGVEEVPVVPVESHLELATYLKEALGFTLYVTVVGSHWPQAEGPDELEIATVLRRPTRPSLAFSWRVRIPEDGEIPSLFPLFAGADWQEREQYDLVGVHFSDHPDLRRLMLPEDWEGFPLRKEYAIETPHPPWR